jgi:hypothetical protein
MRDLEQYQHEHLVRRSFHLLREVIEKKPTFSGHNDYIIERSTDLLKALRGEIEYVWNKKTSVIAEIKPDKDEEHKMTATEWLNCVESGGFIDYDGYGALATESGCSNIVISPSDVSVLKLKIPTWSTHIVWYNR